MTTLTAPPRSLVQELEQKGVSFELISHPRTTTALARARALGIDPAKVAKTVVVTTSGGFVRAVLPATRRLDLAKVRRVLGEPELRLATEETLAGAYPEFELGAVSPFARVNGDRVLVDWRVCANRSVVLEAGTHRQSLRLGTFDLLQLADAEIADLCAD